MATLLLAFAPLVLSSPAFALTEDEYNEQVALAQADLEAAKEALASAETALAAAEQLQAEVIQAVTDAQKILTDKSTTLKERLAAVATAKIAVDEAQFNYDNNLIADPDWTPLTHEVQHTRIITETISVPHISRIPHTTTTVSGGITAKVFNRNGYNEAPPMPSANEQPIHTTTVSNIDFQWGSGQVLNSGRSEDVIVLFSGNIVVPTTGLYYLYTPADDGTKLYLDEELLSDDWYDKGGGGSTVAVYLEAGISHTFKLYYYENGGGAAVSFQYYTPESPWYRVVPAAWLGTQIQETTTWEEVTTWTEETTTREEIFYTTEVIPDQTAPQIKNPALLLLIEEPTRIYNNAISDYETAETEVDAATTELNTLQDQESQNAVTIDTAQQNVTMTKQAVTNAQSKLEAIPSFTKPTPTPEKTTEPTPEPEETIPPEIPEPINPTPEEPKPELPVNVETVDPQTLTDAQVEELKSVANEILNNSEQGSPEYEQALDALFVAAEADDIVVDEQLASVPVLGATVVALTDAINFMGNVGSDMSPKVREESKKIVVSAVVAVGAAVNAATGAALTAAAPSAGGASNNIRRTK